MKTRKKWLFLFLSLCGLGFSGTFFVQSTFFENWLRFKLHQEITSLLGEEVWLGDLQINLLDSSISIDGVFFYNLNAKDPFASIDKLQIDFQLLNKNQWIKRIEIIRPNAELHWTEEGLQSFQKMKVGSNASQKKFPWEEMVIEKANVSLHGPQFSYYLPRIYIDYKNGLTDISLGESRLDLENQQWRMEELSFVDIEISPLVFDANNVDFTVYRTTNPDAKLHLEGRLRVEKDTQLQQARKLSGELFLHGDTSAFQISPLLKFNGAMILSATVAGTMQQPAIDGNLLTEHIELLRKRNMVWQSIPLGSPVASWNYIDQKLYLLDLHTNWADGQIRSNIEVDFNNNALEIGAFGKDISVYRLGQNLYLSNNPWLDADVDIKTSMTGALSPFLLSGPLDFTVKNLMVADSDVRAKKLPILSFEQIVMNGEWGVDRKSMNIAIDHLKTAKNEASAGAQLSFTGDKWVRYSFDFTHFDLSEFKLSGSRLFTGVGKLQGFIERKDNQLILQAATNLNQFSVADLPVADRFSSKIISHGLKNIDFQNMVGVKGKTRMSGPLQLRFGKKVNMRSVIKTNDGRAQDLMSIFFSLPNVDSEASGWARFQGPVDDLMIQSKIDLRNADVFGEKFESGNISLNMDKGNVTVEGLELVRNNAQESLFLRGSTSSDKQQFEVIGSNLAIQKLDFIKNYNVPIAGLLDFNAVFSGDDLLPTGSAMFHSLTFNGNPVFPGRLDFKDNGKRIVLHGGIPKANFLLDGHLGSKWTEPYAINLRFARTPVHLLLPKTNNNMAFRSWIESSVQIKKDTQGNYELTGNINDFSASWEDAHLRIIQPAAIKYSQHHLSFDPLIFVDDGKTSVVLSGRRDSNKELDFSLRGLMDLHLLQAWVPGMTRSTGTASVHGVLKGIYPNLTQNIDVQVKSGTMLGGWFPHPIEEINGHIRVSPSRFQLPPKGARRKKIVARVGGKNVEVSGYIDATQYIPKKAYIDFNLLGNRLQMVDFLPPAKFKGKLRLTGPFERLLLKGDLAVQEMLFSERIDWEDTLLAFSPDLVSQISTDDSQDSFLSFHVGITAEDTVRVRNNVADMNAAAQFQLIGDIDKPGLQGWVRAQPGGRILLKERDFEIERAELRFVEPYSFDPELDIFLETRVSSIEQDVDIQYYISGTYEDWQTQTYSTPSLPQADINALLLFGMTRDEAERLGGLGSALAVEGSDLLASKLRVVERFHNISEGLFQGDLLNYLDRIDFISGTSARGSRSFSSSLRLLAEKDLNPMTTIIMEKNISQAEDFYFSLEQKLAKSIFLNGFWASEQQGRYLNIGGAYGLGFQWRWELDL